MKHLTYKFANTPEEILQAQRLRYQIFNVEIGGEPPAADSPLLDQDEFDNICDHLIVIDTEKDAIVGTYRLLREDVALSSQKGFYSAKKFSIRGILQLSGGILEVGRSCVAPPYRNHFVLNLLWEGIAKYAVEHRLRYIFGSANIMSADPLQISRFWQMIKQLDLYQKMDVAPLHPVPLTNGFLLESPKKLFEELPLLFKGYLKMGLKVCGLPTWGDFHTALFPIILDIKETRQPFKKKFFGRYLE